jgi:hypothetical protein
MGGAKSVDVMVPSKLLPKLGLKHQVLEPSEVNETFDYYYKQSATFARERHGTLAYALYSHFGTEFTLLNSNVSEVTQGLYWLPQSQLGGPGLAIATGFYHPLAIKEYDKWFRGAREACDLAGLNILALFHWELRMGRWAAAAFSEYDIVHETFTPYNNRYFNEVLLGISERFRRNRMWYVPLKHIRQIWPELLSEPINPADNIVGHLKDSFRRKLLHNFVTPWIPAYEYAKFCQKRKKMDLINRKNVQ